MEKRKRFANTSPARNPTLAPKEGGGPRSRPDGVRRFFPCRARGRYVARVPRPPGFARAANSWRIDRSFPVGKLTGGEKLPKIPQVTILRRALGRRERKRRRPGARRIERPAGRFVPAGARSPRRSATTNCLGRLAAAGAALAGPAAGRLIRAAGGVTAAGAGALRAGADAPLAATAAPAPAGAGVGRGGWLPREGQGDEGERREGKELGHGKDLHGKVEGIDS